MQTNRVKSSDLYAKDDLSERVPIYDPKPSSHDCMDAGGRATQEQLPKDDLKELQGRIYAFSDHKAVLATSLKVAKIRMWSE